MIKKKMDYFNDINKELNELVSFKEEDESLNLKTKQVPNTKEILIRKKKPELVRYIPPPARKISTLMNIKDELIQATDEMLEPNTIIQVTLDENNNHINVNIYFIF